MQTTQQLSSDNVKLIDPLSIHDVITFSRHSLTHIKHVLKAQSKHKYRNLSVKIYIFIYYLLKQADYHQQKGAN